MNSLSPWFDKCALSSGYLSLEDRQLLNEHHYLCLRQLIGKPKNLPSTPEKVGSHLEHPEVLRLASLLRSLSMELGQPYTNPNMKQAEYFVQQIFPVRGREVSNSAASSTKALEMHSEHAMFSTAPDYLIIGCLKNPDHVGTWVAPFHLEALKAHTVQVLKSAYGDSELQSLQLPILELEESKLKRLRFDPVFMSFSDAAENEAFSQLCEALNHSKISVCLEPGDVLILDNRSCVHGRESFGAKFDGHDRWMMRTMTT